MKNNAFTLAELLIALVILGVIATFTIPKVLSSQQSSQFKATAKEVAGMVSGAYSAYQQSNTPVAGTLPIDLSPYMNYVRVETAGSTMDGEYTVGTYTCNSSTPCVQLHNGAKMMFYLRSFGNTASTNAIQFIVDPDGKVTDGTTNGPGKSVTFILYYDGRLTSYSNMRSGSYDSSGAMTSCPLCDPPWFGWN